MTNIVRRADGFWITDLPMNTPDIGPYERDRGNDSEQCAQEALRSLERFFMVDYWDGYTPQKKVMVKVRRLTDS